MDESEQEHWSPALLVQPYTAKGTQNDREKGSDEDRGL
jgi:hypothetical protein